MVFEKGLFNSWILLADQPWILPLNFSNPRPVLLENLYFLEMAYLSNLLTDFLFFIRDELGRTLPFEEEEGFASPLRFPPYPLV